MKKCIEQLRFNDLAEFGDYIYELVNKTFQTVTAVLFYDDAIELIKWFMLYEDITVGGVEIENSDYHGHNKEFYVTLNKDLILEVVPASQLQINESADKYFYANSDIIFYNEDVSSKIITQNNHCDKYKLVIGDYENENICGDCCGDCTNCFQIESSKDITETLALMDYILNHLDT